MRVSVFKAWKDAVAKLPDGTELKFKWDPRAMTRDKSKIFDDYQAPKEGEERDSEQGFDAFLDYTLAIVKWIDLQDDNDQDIPVTRESLLEIGIDAMTLMAFHAAIREERERPTAEASGEASSGLSQEDASTPTASPKKK